MTLVRAGVKFRLAITQRKELYSDISHLACERDVPGLATVTEPAKRGRVSVPIRSPLRSGRERGHAGQYWQHGTWLEVSSADKPGSQAWWFDDCPSNDSGTIEPVGSPVQVTISLGQATVPDVRDDTQVSTCTSPWRRPHDPAKVSAPAQRE
jgi:hypothetical protein